MLLVQGGPDGIRYHKPRQHKQVRHLNRILHVDEENLTVTAEPSVTMGELTNELMPRGLALQADMMKSSSSI